MRKKVSIYHIFNLLKETDVNLSQIRIQNKCTNSDLIFPYTSLLMSSDLTTVSEPTVYLIFHADFKEEFLNFFIIVIL